MSSLANQGFKPKSNLASFIKLPSLEPKGVLTPLPEILMGGGFKRADIMKYVAVPRYELLPRGLIPRPQSEARPPKFHYGWEIDENRLMDYATQHNLLWGPNIREPPPDGDWSKLPKDPEPIEIDEIASMRHALEAIISTISSSPPRTVRIEPAMNTPSGALIVSIYTNFDLDKAPSEEFIERFRVALGQSTKPVWFLDGTEIVWRPRYTRRN